MQAVDELVPRSAHGVGRRLARVLEQLHPQHRVDLQRAKDQQVGHHEGGRAEHQQGQHGDDAVGEPVLADRAPRAHHDTEDGAQQRADDH
jgi:hypothetical protein